MDTVTVERWIEGYVRAWRTPGTAPLDDLFTPEATYRPSPWRTPWRGRDELARFWDGGRDGPDEEFTLVPEVVAVDAPAATAVARTEVTYGNGSGPWRNLWVLRFADDGRCAAFEEWPFSPDQPDGQGDGPG